ncbi:MAG: hypothetical protein V9G12_17900 [Microthrixaceae bacterium]
MGIEHAHLAQHRGSQEDPAPAEAPDLVGGQVGAIPLAEPPLEPLDPGGERRADAVDPAVTTRSGPHREAAIVAERDLDVGRLGADGDVHGRAPIERADQAEGHGLVCPFDHAVVDAAAGDVDAVDRDGHDRPGSRQIDRCERCLEEHLGSDGTDRAVVQHCDEGSEPTGLDDGIVVDERHGVAPVEVAEGAVVPSAKPRLWSLATKRTPSRSWRNRASEPSIDALSTTTISNRSGG